ncbi:DUF3089 domain-containing protein [Sphingomonas sp. So64.6b]|uniref:DUF3089 domain-containing protein n=1 Tax=Sphingomonas sp. So64.6b TaxID=2997354 RepID=UPI001600B175|nr:DUF3089 domain-containing protein [Sphingomonas sp. So64.6b]QNA82648.1 DUF3089 domain-containing protein [Sphingomonas sp. So64.6b]
MKSTALLLALIATPAAAQTTTPPPTPENAPPALINAPPPPASPSPAPDYKQDASWLCRPGRADACAANQDVTIIRPDGKQKIEKFKPDQLIQFDCFYVYPTVSLDTSPNSDMTAGDEERTVAAAQAARFSQKCKVYAPLYRQVTLTALQAVLQGKPLAADRAMAYADVKAAWEDYLERDNNGRGVVLIGHSQGAGILKELIAKEIEPNRATLKKIASAMLIGTNVAVPTGQVVGGDFKKMPLCRADGQYNCVVTYVTFRADSPPPAGSRFGKVATAGQSVGCTNPAALAGGKAVTNAILGAKGAGFGSAPMGPWATGGLPVTTSFVKVPGLISAECVSNDGFDYLAVTVNADPKDARTDTIVGDVVVGGQMLKDWGLHLIDMPVEMGDLVTLADRQAAEWRGVPWKSRK